MIYTWYAVGTSFVAVCISWISYYFRQEVPVFPTKICSSHKAENLVGDTNIKERPEIFLRFYLMHAACIMVVGSFPSSSTVGQIIF